MYASRRQLTYLIALLGVASILLVQISASNGDSVAFSKRYISRASVYLITADLGDPNVKVDIGLPEKGLSHSEAFGHFVKRRAPIAAVTGTYFDTRTLLPTGSIVSGGRTVFENHIGTAVCFLPGNKVRFIDARVGQRCDLNGAECALRTGPRLLANGGYVLNPRREGFHHPGLFGARTRMALGVTSGRTLLLVSVRTPVTFAHLAGIMKTLGAVDAVCLDGGTSSAMYYKGQIVRRPGRTLTNIVEVRENPQVAEKPRLLAATYGNAYVLRIRGQLVTAGWTAQHPEKTEPSAYAENYEQPAVLADPGKLRFAKGLHSFFPVHGAKLTGLKRLNNA